MREIKNLLARSQRYIVSVSQYLTKQGFDI